MPFDGFPRNVRATPVPDPLFNSLLEEIEDVAELKVTLRLVWLLGQKRGQLRFVHEEELLGDGTLARGLRSLGGEPAERIRQGLNLAIARGTVLRHLSGETHGNPVYLLNTDDNRRRLQNPVGMAVETGPAPGFPDGQGEATGVSRGDPAASIFDLYENNIGTIGPLMAEQLAEAEERYPSQWIEEAFRLATFENKRSWRYIAAILRRWAAEGRAGYDNSADVPPAGLPGVGVKAGAALWEEDGRQHGESGRHPEENDGPGPPRSRQRR